MITKIGRRSFLKLGAGAAGGLVLGVRLPGQSAAARKLNAWVHIAPDNHVTLVLEKSEMGQGIMTAVPMILAEELCVDWKNIVVQQAPTDPEIYNHGTGGSGSVAGCWLPMRRAGAAAR